MGYDIMRFPVRSDITVLPADNPRGVSSIEIRETDGIVVINDYHTGKVSVSKAPSPKENKIWDMT